MSRFGIDVSEHNGIIDWEKAKNKIDFAILRLGWIGNNNNHTLDKKFDRNYNECKRLGINIGIYVYCYCNSINSAISGADWTINNIRDKKLELPVYIDMEEKTIASQGKETLTNICHTFNKKIEDAGFYAGVYANKDWFNNYLKKEEIRNRYTTWIATYKEGTNLYEGEYDMWQNSSSGQVDGIDGKTDTNFMYRDLLSEILQNTEPNILCKAHIQDYGWTEYNDCSNGIGTENQSKRLEAIEFKTNNGIEMEYRVHVQDIGWQEWKKSGEIAGTTGEEKRIEAIEIKCNKVLEVSEHIEDVGWMPKSTGKEIHVGTIGKSLRLEAFRINVI